LGPIARLGAGAAIAIGFVYSQSTTSSLPSHFLQSKPDQGLGENRAVLTFLLHSETINSFQI